MELKDFSYGYSSFIDINKQRPHPHGEMIFVKNLSKPSGVDRRVFTDETRMVFI